MRPDEDDLQIRDPQTYAIIGAAMAVHGHLGPGYLERPYAEAMAIELAERNVPFQAEVPMDIHYKGQKLDAHYRADLLCFGEVVVELKAQASIGKPEAAQLVNYLKASRNERGLLLNFGGPSLEKRRIIFKADWERQPTESKESEKSENPQAGP